MYHVTNYNCLHYALNKFREFTGINIPVVITDGKLTSDTTGLFHKCESNTSEICMVFMRSNQVHVGVLNNGFVYHLDEMGEHKDNLYNILAIYGNVTFYGLNQNDYSNSN
jgi:hypothetical protein|nr:MAG TPA: hypothetical protein [Caudoviricetes sp.]